MNKDKKVTTYKGKYIDMTIEDGIFCMYYHPLNSMNLEVAKSIVKERLTFVNGISYPCLFDLTKVKEATKEARDYMADKGNDLVLASAILVNSPLLKMGANFFIMVNKPKSPTRMFTSKESAIEWLGQFKT